MNAREGSWTGDLLIVDTEDLKTMPPSEIHVKKLQIKRGGHSQEKQRICFPMQDGRNIARTAAVLHRCVQSEGRLRARISTQFFTRKRRSPRSRSTCWSSTRFLYYYGTLHMYRNHVGTRTKLHVPRDDFPIPLSHTDAQRHENGQWCTSRSDHRWLLEHGCR